jgi:ERCC4-related helicase
MSKSIVTVLLGLLIIGGAPIALPGMAEAQQSRTLPSAASTTESRVEARIKSLHDRLKITGAEEPQWNGVAQAMRDNAGQMQQAMQQRQQSRSMSAVDDLKAYQAIAEAHAQGLQKLIPAFQTLYDSLSDAQKKQADALFGDSSHHKKAARKTADAATPGAERAR